MSDVERFVANDRFARELGIQVTARGDGAATAFGNEIKKKSDLEKAALWAKDITGILGGVAIVEDRMATWGDIELVAL